MNRAMHREIDRKRDRRSEGRESFALSGRTLDSVSLVNGGARTCLPLRQSLSAECVPTDFGPRGGGLGCGDLDLGRREQNSLKG